jgi:hypothetical protein
MNREQLEIRIKELGVLIEEASGNVKKLVDEQNNLTNDLEDINKPKLNDAQWNDVQRIVEVACESFEPELGDCEYELELNYDNKIELQSVDLGYQLNDLAEHIMDRLTEVFGTVKEEE